MHWKRCEACLSKMYPDEPYCKACLNCCCTCEEEKTVTEQEAFDDLMLAVEDMIQNPSEETVEHTLDLIKAIKRQRAEEEAFEETCEEFVSEFRELSEEEKNWIKEYMQHTIDLIKNRQRAEEEEFRCG